MKRGPIYTDHEPASRPRMKEWKSDSGRGNTRRQCGKYSPNTPAPLVKCTGRPLRLWARQEVSQETSRKAGAET
ncbi:uncharacterized protein BCR38DRAFT_421707 [Pseudomassariella vexata]|uniref:Uncharacterized protein n=1 Tax=Pseudomassariella vexata TaxID=1141098 RepID=A0A1Y2EHN8_9PEZI|nr:uncharacterized protein BCR38DRAFT_421707 [Pseudomassariella vexata]ORY70295.1 hypothetical protein BCR38DRAFT_421707 [Pseudomassariella vexata]